MIWSHGSAKPGKTFHRAKAWVKAEEQREAR